MVHRFDFLVIGSGIAGLSYALKVANIGNVALLCKSTLEESNTFYAQGGIASVTLPCDGFEKHINDTLIAGDGICNKNIVKKVVYEAPKQIKELIRFGVNFDKDSQGVFSLHKEGGHSEFRILHHKDSTGQEIQKKLINAVRKHKNIFVFDHHFVIEILTQQHLGIEVIKNDANIECYGAYVLCEETNKVHTFLSKITMICTGGIGNIYQITTNSIISTGDGIAIVYRAKGRIRDMEFVQFHPTALYNPTERPSFLISEALRGYGAILRTKEGKEFMHNYDYRGSLAPRDIVARAIYTEMKKNGSNFVYLDLTHKNVEETKKSYPTIYEKCLNIGIDITKMYIPVAPAAHYLCGGIVVDEKAKTNICRLYAAGECSCTGLHGANRLASNSLIEAIVYADAAAKHSIEKFSQYVFNENIPMWSNKGFFLSEDKILIEQNIKEIETIMSNYVGIVRSNLCLKFAMNRLKAIYEETENLFSKSVISRNICELRNIACIGYLVVKQAMKRKESIGLHYTVDYPKTKLLKL
ncbi:MAG: L-aspartate oxidase [Bacteroidales bacterium OttesenSCG-928-I14]|jgi:L-aspartate oxidase|nr:L-aspartate oxidase [Bacteroidales bacterium OttesenSCG-928-I14]